MERDAFESQTIELTSFEVEGDRILTRQPTTTRGAGSGIEMEIDTFALWTFDDHGRVARVEVFTTSEEETARRGLRAES